MGFSIVGGNRILKKTQRTDGFEIIDKFLSSVDFFDNQNHSVCFDACIRFKVKKNFDLLTS